MRQVCNVAFAAQVESIIDQDELELFVDGLPLPPNMEPRRRQRVSEDLLNRLAPTTALPAQAR